MLDQLPAHTSDFFKQMQFHLRNRKLLAVLVVTLILLALPLVRYALFISLPAGNGSNVRIFDFEKGYSLRKIAEELEKARIISNARLFVIQARIRGDSEHLQAGEYQFTDAMRPAEILRKMVAGEIHARKFAVPEGYSIYQIAELLEGQGFFTKEAFLRQSSNPRLLSELGIDGKTVEGYLYPSTYNITRKMDEAALIRAMVSQFNRVFDDKFAIKAKGRSMSRKDVVTLASMIEKEAIVPTERPLISSVFHNRLRIRMRLQSDPTAVYGIRAFAGAVSKQDVERHTPYNTYQIDTLPPGPIGNPGSGSLEAALDPAKSNYLYFVAKKDGTHHFSATLEEHNKAVHAYLK